MTLGRRVEYEMVSVDGEERYRVVPVPIDPIPPGEREEERDFRQMWRFLGIAHKPAGEPDTLQDATVLRIKSPIPFTKYALWTNMSQDIRIGLDSEPTLASATEHGSYDDIVPGATNGAFREDFCLPTTEFNMIFSGAPAGADRVYVWLYAGRPALFPSR